MNKKFVIFASIMLVAMTILIIFSNVKKTDSEITVASQESTLSNNIEENGAKKEAESYDKKESVGKQANTGAGTSEKDDDNDDVNTEKYSSELKKEESDSVKSNTAPTGNTKYYIKVNYQANAVTIYQKDDDGYYTVPVKAMICSCGTATPTSGVYKTSAGYEWGYLEGGTYGRYSTRIKGGIMFHSVPYVEESEDTLEYWEYDKLGTTASLGCVRLCVRDCKWIFDNCEVGTPVEFYADSNPGPLGKPTAQKISDNEECRNWDPTDPSPDNPWN
ncbi:MAG: L,D-transpeptidase family protein [Clostridia bacterium]|nr:L,D-transpeptidase family protein [Clostridia bacterium]